MHCCFNINHFPYCNDMERINSNTCHIKRTDDKCSCKDKTTTTTTKKAQRRSSKNQNSDVPLQQSCPRSDSSKLREVILPHLVSCDEATCGCAASTSGLPSTRGTRTFCRESSEGPWRWLGTGASHIWEKAQRARTVQSGEEKALGGICQSL